VSNPLEEVFGDAASVIIPILMWLLDGAKLILPLVLPEPFATIAIIALNILDQIVEDLGLT